MVKWLELGLSKKEQHSTVRNEIFEPNQTVLVKIFSITNIVPRNVHSAILIKPMRNVCHSIIGNYQDWNMQLDNGIITIMRMIVDK